MFYNLTSALITLLIIAALQLPLCSLSTRFLTAAERAVDTTDIRSAPVQRSGNAADTSSNLTSGRSLWL